MGSSADFDWIPEDFGNWLLNTPLLHTIHFFYHSEPPPHTFSIDSPDPQFPPGSVRSYRHQGEELLLVRLLVLKRDVVIWSGPTTSEDQSWYQLHTNWPARQVEEEVKVYEPEWWNWTFFEESEVPMDILEKMREVEGSSEEEWSRRGVEVGAEAWAILKKYMED